jgi:hypothetical protein
VKVFGVHSATSTRHACAQRVGRKNTRIFKSSWSNITFELEIGETTEEFENSKIGKKVTTHTRNYWRAKKKVKRTNIDTMLEKEKLEDINTMTIKQIFSSFRDPKGRKFSLLKPFYF